MSSKTMQRATGTTATTGTKRKRWPHRTRWKIAVRQQFKCALCKSGLSEDFDVDHINPLCAGGRDEFMNLQILCVPCHRLKTALEGGARSRPGGEMFCEVCGYYFSKYFLRSHVHRPHF